MTTTDTTPVDGLMLIVRDSAPGGEFTVSWATWVEADNCWNVTWETVKRGRPTGTLVLTDASFQQWITRPHVTAENPAE